ncbi:MAG TPA: hypothetical protein VF792_06140 [Ktedonobacterales bacterium]
MGQRTTVTEAPDAQASLTPSERIVAAVLPSLGDVLFVCALLIGLLGLQGRILGVDGDVGWNIALGSLTLEHGLPRTEPFLSGRLGQPTVHWEWLSQVVYAVAFRLGGLNGVVTVTSILMATTLLALYWILRRHGASPLTAIGLSLVGTVLVEMAWTARAQVFSLLFMVWWAEWLWRYWHDGKRWRLWLFPAATALWVNFHAGWLGGIALLGVATLLALLTPPARRVANPVGLAATLAGSLLATLLNPWGVGYWNHLLTFTLNPLIARYTQEYQSPDFHLPALWAYLALVFALVTIWLLAARAGRHIEPVALVMCGLWTTLAFLYVRFVPIWPLVCLPYLADALPGRYGAPAHDTAASGSDWRLRLAAQARNVWARLASVSARVGDMEQLIGRGVWPVAALLCVTLLVANGGHVPGRSAPLLNARWDSHAFPVAAVQRLRHDGLPQGRGYNPYEWGGYLDEALPEYHVFIDSRSDVYGKQFLADYVTISDGDPGWDTLLTRYHVQWALLQSNAPLRQALALSGWRCQAEDAQGVASLCVRPSGSNAAMRSPASADIVADVRTRSNWSNS